jgi:hypothetical protein
MTYLDQPVVHLHHVREIKQWYDGIMKKFAYPLLRSQHWSQVDRELVEEIRLMMEIVPPCHLADHQRAMLVSLCERGATPTKGSTKGARG